MEDYLPGYSLASLNSEFKALKPHSVLPDVYKVPNELSAVLERNGVLTQWCP